MNEVIKNEEKIVKIIESLSYAVNWLDNAYGSETEKKRMLEVIDYIEYDLKALRKLYE